VIGTVEVVARAVARARRRYQLIRSTSPFAPDEMPVFGFAPIKLVSEEVVQAIAFGDLDGRPIVVTRWNPLSRDASAFEAFAAELNAYITTALRDNRLPRVWVPHEAALRQLELLGHRYRNNQRATSSLQRMGAQCRAFMEEYQHEGQQVVAVAAELLRRQIVTGQSPAEDAHLGALLAWVENAGDDPGLEAARRSLVPAAAMLTRKEDDEVEALRPVAKKGGTAGARAKTRIEQILASAAQREWDLLTRARSALAVLGLPTILGIDQLTSASRERVSYSLSNLPSPPSRTVALARLLDELESSAERAEDANLEGDPQTRELLRRAGRVMEAVVESVDQLRRGRRPCRITLFTNQPVLRVRAGTTLRLVGSQLRARVGSVAVDAARNGHIIAIEVTNGVRSRPEVGATANWTDSAPFGADFLQKLIYRAASAVGPAALTGQPLSPPMPRTFEPDENLGEIANALRRP
jgi:hypothetical protein